MDYVVADNGLRISLEPKRKPITYPVRLTETELAQIVSFGCHVNVVPMDGVKKA